MSRLNIRTGEKRFPVAPDLYGLFFEDISRAGDGGLYPEMLRNRFLRDTPFPAKTAEVVFENDLHNWVSFFRVQSGRSCVHRIPLSDPRVKNRNVVLWFDFTTCGWVHFVSSVSRPLTMALWAVFGWEESPFLPDRIRPRNRPHEADRSVFPSVRLTVFLCLFSVSQIRPRKRRGRFRRCLY